MKWLFAHLGDAMGAAVLFSLLYGGIWIASAMQAPGIGQ